METGHLKKVLESEYRSLLEMSGNEARLIKQIHMRQTDEVSVDNCKGRSLYIICRVGVDVNSVSSYLFYHVHDFDNVR